MVEYNPELNFLTQFKLNRNGMILEIKNEFDILRLALSQMSQLGNDYKEILDRIMVMPLRKLLFENQHPSILLEICPEFKMPKLEGNHIEGEDGLHMMLPPYKFGEIDEWITVEEWAKQYIAYYEKDVLDLPKVISADTFECILNQLKKVDKQQMLSFFDKSDISYLGCVC